MTAPKRPDRRAPAGTVVVAYLRQQVAVLHEMEDDARRDTPDAVHRMRVATRRLRSALTTYRRLFHRRQTDPLRDELQWLGQVLGRARDAEVLRVRLDQRVAEQPSELVIGPVRSRIRLEMDDRHHLARHEVVRVLDGERYRALLGGLDRLVDRPPLRGRARRRADRVIPPLAGGAARRVDAKARAVAARAPGGPHQGERIHEVRKAAKRARYAAEVARPVAGPPARRLERRMAALQEVLGEHQDTIGAREVLREIAIAAHLAGENGFTFGVLHGAERTLGEQAMGAYPAAVAAASKGKARKWTTG